MATVKPQKSGRKQKQKPPAPQPPKGRGERRPARSAGGPFIEPPDGIKMSKVLEAFVEPYVDLTKSLDELRSLFMIAILAWNIALLPEDQQQAAVEDLVRKAITAEGEETEESQEDLKGMLYELIARKEMLFAEYRRLILNFELVETRDQYHLTVLSSPEGSPA